MNCSRAVAEVMIVGNQERPISRIGIVITIISDYIMCMRVLVGIETGRYM